MAFLLLWFGDLLDVLLWFGDLLIVGHFTFFTLLNFFTPTTDFTLFT